VSRQPRSDVHNRQGRGHAAVTFVIGVALFVALAALADGLERLGRPEQPITLAFFRDQDCRYARDQRARGLLYVAIVSG
jgi:hypothetical protein